MRETIIPYNVECEEQRPLLTNTPTNAPRQDENIPEALEQWSFTKLEDQMDKAQLRLILFQSEAKCRQLEDENKRLKEMVQNNAGSHKEESVKSPERAPIHEEVFQIVAYMEYPQKLLEEKAEVEPSTIKVAEEKAQVEPSTLLVEEKDKVEPSTIMWAEEKAQVEPSTIKVAEEKAQVEPSTLLMEEKAEVEPSTIIVAEEKAEV